MTNSDSYYRTHDDLQQHRLEELRRAMGGVSYTRDSAAPAGLVKQEPTSGSGKLAQNTSVRSKDTSAEAVV